MRVISCGSQTVENRRALSERENSFSPTGTKTGGPFNKSVIERESSALFARLSLSILH